MASFEDVKLPSFQEIIAKVDASRLALSVAQDVAGRIRQSIREKRLLPPLKQPTIKRKQRDSRTTAGAASVPLMHTGLLHDSIRAKQDGKNRAAVVIDERTYGAHAKVSSLKTRKERWKKLSAKEQAKRRVGKRSTPATTNQVASWHNEGTKTAPKREFFKLPEDFARIVQERFDAWVAPVLDRVFGK
ncbi:hypothetical protein GX586_16050 [bacterium]|nr:hypothetical protein [bacterium]